MNFKTIFTLHNIISIIYVYTHTHTCIYIPIYTSNHYLKESLKVLCPLLSGLYILVHISDMRTYIAIYSKAFIIVKGHLINSNKCDKAIFSIYAVIYQFDNKISHTHI